MFIVAGGLWLIGCFLALRYRKALKPLCIGLLRHRTQLIIGLIILSLAAVVYRGYLLAFTDHYAQHRWFGKRWDMAGHGIESLRYLSFYSLTMMLSPLGLLAFLPGLGYIGRTGIRRASFAPLAVCALGFFAALTIKQLTTPYLYYFGRYLVSELLPLAIVCAAIGIHALARYLPQFKAIAIILYCGCVFTLLYPSLHARLRIREGRQFFEAMSCIDQATPGRSVIFIDKKSFAETPVVTALRLSFQKPTFALRETDFGPPEKLQSLIDYFREKGFAVHLLSSGEAWNAKGGFNKIMRIPAIMRKIGGRAQPPTKMNTLSLPIRLYSLEKPAKLPEICQKVMGYSRGKQF
jgi:hypothetical protein